jgi:hypothetical protein
MPGKPTVWCRMHKVSSSLTCSIFPTASIPQWYAERRGWAQIAAILATRQSRAGSPPALRDRMCIAAVLSLARTGPPGVTSPLRGGTGTPSTTAGATGKRAGSGVSSGHSGQARHTRTLGTS